MDAPGRASWKSRTGFILALVGSSLGLGNIWRFPYAAYKSGGGAFLIPYAVALISIGIPLMILELAIGHKFRASAPLALSRIGRRWELLGWWMVVIVFLGLELYYCVVISWCVNYLGFSIGLDWGRSTGDFFKTSFLKCSSGPFELGGCVFPILIGLAIVWLINWVIVYNGIRKGIELANKIMIPFLGAIIVALAVWSLSFSGGLKGVSAFLTPDFSRLTDPTIWSTAFSQVFFSLSLASGVMIAYASYLPRKADLKSSAIIACGVDCAFALIAGVAVFATLGHMSKVSGLPLEKVVSIGPGLAFVTYPNAINLLPYGQHIFAVLFFLSLILAGITSSIAVFEAATSSLIDKFGWKRKKVTTVLAIIGFTGGVIFATRSGLYWLDLVDYIMNHFGLLTAGFLEAILIGWIYKAVNLREHINAAAIGAEDEIQKRKKRISFGGLWNFVIMIWIPLVLGALIVFELLKLIAKPYNNYDWLFFAPVGLGWLVLTILIAIFLKTRSWRKPPAKEKS